MGYTMGYIDSQPMAGTLLFIYKSKKKIYT